jgi:hypothetical protein
MIVAVCQADEFHAIGEVLGWHEVGHQRRRGRSEEGAGHAEHGQDREDRRRSGEPAQGQQKDRQRAGGLQQRGQPHDQPAAEAVGGGARHQDQEQRRGELDHPDQPEIERVAGEVVDLPADGNGDDLGREGGEEPCRPVAQERAVSERGVASVGWNGFDGHRIGGRNSEMRRP